jgi:hypothetical protein
MTLGSKSSGCKPSRKTAHASYKSYRSQILPSRANANISSGAISGSSSSHHVQHNFSKISGGGARHTTGKETLNLGEIQVRTSKDHLVYQERMESMTNTERRNLDTLLTAGAQAEDDDGPPVMDILDILSGKDSVDISHVGGEFADLLALGDDLLGPSSW